MPFPGSSSGYDTQSLQAPTSLQTPGLTPQTQQPPQQLHSKTSSLIFVDAGVQDAEGLISSRSGNLSANTEVVYLNTTEDAIDQITRTLLKYDGISSVHLFSHGDSGRLTFSNGWLATDNLSHYTAQIKSWSQALSTDADILLYGCDVAGGVAGAAFIRELGMLSQADIAASTNKTGKGGDWILEAQTGSIEATVVPDQASQISYGHSLDAIKLLSQSDSTLASDAVGGTMTDRSVSKDGKFIVFSSAATNLVAGDTNNRRDVYLYDRSTATPTTKLISSITGNPTQSANGDSIEASISKDGRYVTFLSNAKNLTTDVVTGNTNQLYRWDRTTNETVLISQSATAVGDGNVGEAVMSEDGKSIAFISTSSNLSGKFDDVTPIIDNNGKQDAFLWREGQGPLLISMTPTFKSDDDSVNSGLEISDNGRFVTFNTVASLSSKDPGQNDIYVYDASSGGLDIASVDTINDVPFSASVGPAKVSITSSNKLRVVFSSNFVATGDTNGTEDVFIAERDLNVTNSFFEVVKLVSLKPDGLTSGNGGSSNAVISANGRYIAFTSSASDLVTGDTNAKQDVFIRDLDSTDPATATRLISRNSTAGVLGDGTSSKVRISDDGNIVTFTSAAKNLVGGVAANDPNAAGEDVFSYNRTTDTLTLVSQKTGAATTTADLPTGQGIRTLQTPIVSGDGSTIVYANDATNLVSKDTNDSADVFAFNVATPANTLVTTVVSNQNSVTGAGSSTLQPIGSVSKDGRYVVFSSTVNSLVTGDTNAQQDIFLRDTTLLSSDPNSLKLISRSTVSTKSGNGVSSQPFISADGKYVVFSSTASDLQAGDTNSQRDIFLYDVTSGAISAIVSRATALSNAGSDNASVAVDASGEVYVAFTSSATNLGPTVSGGFNNVYLWKKSTGAIALLSRTAAVAGGNQNSTTPIISADGKYVAFSSNASNLEGAGTIDTNTVSDVFLYDITANTLKLVSQSAAGAIGTAASFNPVMSDVGGVVAFESNATNLTAIADTNAATDIFRYAAGVVSLVSVNNAGTAAGSAASGQSGQQSGFTGVSLSADGSSIAFTSLASDLSATTDTNTQSDVFVRNTITNKTTLISQVAGTASNGASSNVVISSDGQTVAFISTATNLSTRDATANADVYISNTTTPGPGLISSDVAGTASSNAAAQTVSLNRDGGGVVFDSSASNLIANDANGFSDVFLRPTKSIVTLKATTATATEGSTTENGVYELTRTDTTGTLQVKLKLDTLVPNAAKPEDFTLTADGGVVVAIASGIATVIFADGISKVTLTLKALTDNKAEAAETAKFTIDLDNAYTIDPVINNGIVTIAANETIVTTNADTGEGSLRQAIANANAFTGADTISFALADPTQKTIALATELAALNTGTTINGGTAGITLDGALAGATANGLTLTGDGNTVNAVTVQNFKGNGIVIAGNNNTIGGIVATNANTLTLNNQGVVVQSGTGNRILGNKISANTLLGIDIAPIGPDTAPAIVFTTALPTPTGAALTGTLTKPAGVYRVEFFANTTQDASLQGEGEIFLGFKDITVDATGTAAVTFDATTAGLTGKYITATVTDAAGSTSEFAKNKLVTPPLPLVELTASVPELLEGASGIVSKYKFNVTLSQAVTTPLTLSYRTLAGAAASGIATAGTDYTAVTTGTVTIAPNTTTASFEIDILGDTRYEVDETFQVEVFGLDTAIVASGTLIATGKIKNDDLKPTISFSKATVSQAEGQVAPNGKMPFTVNLSNASDETITVAYKTVDGTAISTAVGANPVDFIGIPSGTLTFAPGDITKDISVEIIADTVDEPIETFTVELSTPTNATFIASANQITAIGNITPDELPRVDLTASVPELLEGNSGTSKYTFTVKLNQITTAPITLSYRTLAGAAASGIATAGTDYTTITTGTVTIGANSDTATFDIDILGDTRYEVDETFQVELFGLDTTVVTSGTLIATGKIKNDDAKPTISFSQATVSQAEGQVAPNGKMPFTVNLSNASDETITVAYKTIDGTAISTAAGTNLADFIAVPTTTLTFAPGDLTKDLSVEIVADTLDEPIETFTVELSNPTNGTFAASATQITALGTITPDEQGYVFSVLPLVPATVAEGALGTTKTVTFTVALDRIPTEDLTVNYSTVGGTANAGTDYVSKAGTLTFKAGGPLTQTVDVVVNGDDLINGNRDFTLDLSNPTAVRATIDPAKQTSLVTIIDDDLPKISFNPIGVTRFEGPSGQVTQVGVVIDLSAISDQDVTVEFTTLDGTATVADSDYVARTLASQKITILKGQNTATAFFTINGDDKIEADETFLVKLSKPNGAVLSGPDTKSIAILDDDQAIANRPNVSITANPDATQTEGNTGTKSFSFTVTLDKAPTTGKDVTVKVATTDGVGSSGAISTGATPDFTAKTQNLTFISGGPLTQTFTVLVNGDTQLEPTETFTVQLSGATNSLLTTSSAIGTITDDDAPANTPKLTLTAIRGSEPEGNSGTKTLTYAVTLDKAPTAGQPITVDVVTVDGTGATGAISTGAAADFVAKTQTLTFLSTGALTQEFSVIINGDTQAEATETFTLELRNATGAVITTGSAIGTITDDDTLTTAPPVLTVSSVSLTEGDAGTKPFVFDINLTNGPADRAFTVTYEIVEGSATLSDNDYQAPATGRTGTVTFSKGDTKQSITVLVNGDKKLEGTETFTLKLTNPTNSASFSTGGDRGIGSILNDDIADPGNNISLDSLNDLLWRNPTTGETVLWQTNLGPTTRNYTVTNPSYNNSPDWRYYDGADFDQDGNTDHIWYNIKTGQFDIWKMNGTNIDKVTTAVIPQSYNNGVLDTSWQIEDVSDYTGDSKPDILWRNVKTGEVLYWEMNEFRPVKSDLIRTVADLNWEIEAVDKFTGETQKSIFWRNKQTGEMVLWRMSGARLNTIVPINLNLKDFTWKVAATTDLNRDGNSDIIWQNQATNAVTVWYMNRTGLESWESLPTPAEGFRVKAAGDFNQDGINDLFLSNPFSGQNQIWYFQQSPSGISYAGNTYLPNLTSGLQFIGLGRLNPDKIPSLLWTNASNDLVMWQVGPSPYGKSTSLPILSDTNIQVVATVDLDKNGKSEVLLRNILTGEAELGDFIGSSYNRTSKLPTLDQNWVYKGSGDLEGDGDLDLYWQNSITSRINVWKMNGNQYVETVLPTPPPENWFINQIGDFDGDGKADFFWRNIQTDMTSVWLMNGTTIKSPEFIASIDKSWKIFGMKDLDRDGKMDFVWRNSETGQNSVWLMNGSKIKNGFFLPTVQDQSWEMKEVADFDRDGNPDILWYNSKLQTASFWTLEGGRYKSVTFATKTPSPSWNLVGTRDFNGDGSRDLLWLDKATGTPTIWYMNDTKYVASASLPNLSSPNFQLIGIDDYAQTPT